jgi:membrane protease YdiL (CAAX protease family)
MSKPETHEKGVALATKQLVYAWLFGGIIEWTIQYLNRWLSPSTANDNLPFQAVIGDVCAVFFFLWKWPRVFLLSTIRLRVGDLAVGIVLGLLMSNISAAILGRSAVENDWALTNPARKLTLICAVLIVPVVEEMIYRGVILGSLLERTSTLWAVIITTVAATIMHDSWLVAFPSQILLCTAYLIRKRSIPARLLPTLRQMLSSLRQVF